MSFIDWLWWIAGGAIGIAGLVMLMRALFADRSRGRRRCPKCWYSMEGLSGARCPECGREQKRAKRMYHTRRHWRMAALGAMLLAVGGASFFAQRVHQHGWIKATPTWAYIATLPHFDVNGAQYRELAARVSRGGMRYWEYRFLIRRVLGLLEEQSGDPTELFRYAGLLERIEFRGKTEPEIEPHKSWVRVTDIDRFGAIHALAGLLSHSDAIVRQMAMRTLEQFGDQAVPAVPYLLPLRSHPSPETRYFAFRTLRAIRGDTEPLYSRYAENEQLQVFVAELAMCDLDRECAIPLLERALDDGHGPISAFALLSLLDLAENPAAYADRVYEFCNDSRLHVPLVALQELARVPYDSSVEEPLRAALRNSRHRVSYIAALRAIEHHGAECSALLRDVELFLAGSPTPKLIRDPRTQMLDPWFEQWQLAARAYVAMGGDPQTPMQPFQDRIQGASESELPNALAGIYELGIAAPEFAVMIQPHLSHSNPLIRIDAAKAYAVIGGDLDEATRALLDGLREYQNMNAWAKLHLLSRRGLVSSHVLVEMIDSTSSNERYHAAECLENCGASATHALPRVRELLDDPDPIVARAAERAVERLEYEQDKQRR